MGKLSAEDLFLQCKTQAIYTMISKSLSESASAFAITVLFYRNAKESWMKILLQNKYGLFLADHKNVFFTLVLTKVAEENSCHRFLFCSFYVQISVVFETHHRLNCSKINYKHEKKEAIASESIEVFSSFAYFKSWHGKPFITCSTGACLKLCLGSLITATCYSS